MQEQKKYQIEKASHYVSTTDKFIVSFYMPAQDKIMNISFYNKENANKSSELSIGVWREKNMPCQCNKVKPILGYENTIIGEECTECGKTYMIHELYELKSVHNKHFKK